MILNELWEQELFILQRNNAYHFMQVGMIYIYSNGFIIIGLEHIKAKSNNYVFLIVKWKTKITAVKSDSFPQTEFLKAKSEKISL